MPTALIAALACAISLGACGSSAARELPNTTSDATSAAAPATAASGVKLVNVGKFKMPLYVTAPPKDLRRVMVVQQGGRIIVVRDGKALSTPFLDVSSRVTAGGEQGLLGLAFAPDYAKSGLFYVYFTRRDGKQEVAEFKRATSDRASISSYRSVLVMDDPEGNHNGGQLNFGPDGLLYIGTGDGGGGGDQHGTIGNAQNLGSMLGKILRIDPRRAATKAYSVPSSNPFVGRAGARPEVYSYGLRNPWRFSFDRVGGDLIIGDVGEATVEEVDFTSIAQASGGNFGWRVREGDQPFSGGTLSGAIEPVIVRTHDEGWCSVTGGYVVRDAALPSLRGKYLYGDFCEGIIYGARLSSSGAAGNARVSGLPQIAALSSFGEDARGRIYVVSLGGAVSRIAAR
ncbi:MAG: PQQ-dependent sugar dehydrogenase [Solirubrobacteraceae bacterium]|nr:PQQ-dependent sugar dehydrogenase [Solirubrobacteraceae bacterium]